MFPDLIFILNGGLESIKDLKGTQEVFNHRAKMCTLAAKGKWSNNLENK